MLYRFLFLLPAFLNHCFAGWACLAWPCRTARQGQASQPTLLYCTAALPLSKKLWLPIRASNYKETEAQCFFTRPNNMAVAGVAGQRSVIALQSLPYGYLATRRGIA